MNTIRPGVYTTYSISSSHAQNKGRRMGLVAKSKIVQKSVQKITNLREAKQLFGEAEDGNHMLALMETIYANASPIIYAISAESETVAAYRTAFTALLAEEEAYVLCSDFSGNGLDAFLKEKLTELALHGHEKLAVLGETVGSTAISRANAVNSMRICMTFPMITVGNAVLNQAPAILAALLAKNENLSGNLNGEMAIGGSIAGENQSEESLLELLQNGVSVFEQSGNIVELCRGVTTAAKDEEGDFDGTFRNLSVVLITDTVIPQIRKRLKEKLQHSKNSRMALDSIASLVAGQLSDFEDEGLVSSYETPMVYLSDQDATVCIVEIRFVIVQGISQIYLHAQISV